jgi:hypothetical protein
MTVIAARTAPAIGRWTRFGRACAASAVLGALCAGRCAAEDAAGSGWVALIGADDSSSFSLIDGGRSMIEMGSVGWGPRWAWTSTSSKGRATNEVLENDYGIKIGKDTVAVKEHAQADGPQSVTWRYDLAVDEDAPLTEIDVTLAPMGGLGVHTITTTDASGATDTVKEPINSGGAKAPIAKITFSTHEHGDVVFTITPPCRLTWDRGALRVALAHDKLAAGTATTAIQASFPAAVQFQAEAADVAKHAVTLAGADWFPLASADDVGPSVAGFDSWLDKPAGARGGVRMVGDHFELADKTPIKFWGTNLCYTQSAPPKPQAEFTAARFAKYGFNCVRMHKFTDMHGMGIGDDKDCTLLKPDGLDKLDYFCAQLADHGVYYGWSHTYGMTIGPANVAQIDDGKIIMGKFKGNTYGLINIDEDVQDLLIKRTVWLLNHVNPYTKKPYAQDPALAYVELQNEDDIFFYTTSGGYDACPTVRRKLNAGYCAWLTQKYGGQEGLAKAWGDKANGVDLAKGQVAIQTNPWFMGTDHLPSLKGGELRRMLDDAAFLHATQDRFYSRYAKAIRDTGYLGPLVGSPWQAPAMVPHLYNLKSDAEVGYVDRHNYLGGLFNSMLHHPGSGLLSSGLQQVIDRPFGLSEWSEVWPAMYAAESPPMIAAYGFGLQGWDASYEFQSGQNDGKAFNHDVGNEPWDVWDADLPNQQGQGPVLARMIARGDLKEGEVIGVRRVSDQNLLDGAFDFNDVVKQEGDIKSFGGTTPPEALAAGRVVIEFGDGAKPSTYPDMSKYDAGQVVTACTGQLKWAYGAKSYFTIDSAGTKGVVGFAGGGSYPLHEITIAPKTEFASVLITSLEKAKSLADCHAALICATARESNTGFRYLDYNHQLLYGGKAPILIEPVQATLTFARAIDSVHVLDQDGRDTAKTVAAADGAVAIDEAADKAWYYEVVFK